MWSTVVLTPGLNTEKTPTHNRAGYTATNLGRFRDGLFQILGGWTQLYPFQISGVPLALHTWQDLSQNQHLVVGSTTALTDITASVPNIITPQSLDSDASVDVSTTLGSSTVTVADTNIANITTYDSVYLRTPISVGGLILSGMYAVTATVSTTSYQIDAGSAALATVTSGGALPTFTTTSGSATVTVGLTAHGLSAGNDIVFPAASVVGGLTLQGRYVVQSVASADSFTILAAEAASSSAGPTSMNSGDAGFTYWLTQGPQASISGYGTGTYGTGAYGTGSAISGQTGTPISADDYAFDNWGELLIATPENGGVFYWGPSSGYANASIIPGGPPFNSGSFVSMAQQIVVAYGSTASASIGVYQDPLLVRWCDVGNILNWTGEITNQAGEYRIPTGSEIISGCATPQHNVIWTDTDMWLMTYIGAQFVYGFNKVGSRTGLIARHAFTQYGAVTYWWGPGSFWRYGGGADAQELPCPVYDAVFQDLDRNNQDRCFAGVNTAFSEIFWFYPSLSGGLGYCDKYVKYNIAENVWDSGSLQRNAWIDASIFSLPIAASQTGSLYSHENGASADTTGIDCFFETGYFYLDQGQETLFIDRIYPDFRWGLYGGSEDAAINITVKAVSYAGGSPDTYGPYTVTKADPQIELRVHARQIMLRVESVNPDIFWRLGSIRFRVAPDGRR
jgi:hypothetical protein